MASYLGIADGTLPAEHYWHMSALPGHPREDPTDHGQAFRRWGVAVDDCFAVCLTQ